MFTHSTDCYPAPVLYPITQRGFDGLAWNTPWFMVLNTLVLRLVGVWMVRGRRERLALEARQRQRRDSAVKP